MKARTCWTLKTGTDKETGQACMRRNTAPAGEHHQHRVNALLQLHDTRLWPKPLSPQREGWGEKIQNEGKVKKDTMKEEKMEEEKERT